MVTPMVGYQLLKSERATLHALVGARYLWIEVSEKFDFGPPLPVDTIKASESDGSWDALVGVRGDWQFSDKWYGAYQFDVGSGDSDLTWQGIATLNYRFNRFDASFGYRYLGWQDTENDALSDLNMSGFMAGLKFFF